MVCNLFTSCLEVLELLQLKQIGRLFGTIGVFFTKVFVNMFYFYFIMDEFSGFGCLEVSSEGFHFVTKDVCYLFYSLAFLIFGD